MKIGFMLEWVFFDFNYKLIAALARRVYLHKNCGVGKFANSFGSAGTHHLMRQHHRPVYLYLI